MIPRLNAGPGREGSAAEALLLMKINDGRLMLLMKVNDGRLMTLLMGHSSAAIKLVVVNA
jgi:hypothetical protein